jgi:predicted metalloprotease with PDZ domain
VKGSVLGFLLDAKIRRLTSGTKSLDDLLRLLYARFSGAKGYTNDDLRAAVVEVARPLDSARAGPLDSSRGRSDGSSELRTWLTRALETTDELDYKDALDWFGLRMSAAGTASRAWVGVAVRNDNGRAIIVEIRRGSPAYAAGLSLNDEIVSINGVAITPEQLGARVGQFAAGTKITLVIKRHDITQSLDLTLATDPEHGWSLSVSPAPTVEQSRHLTAWLTR